jgi:hypothetical protein
VVSPGSILSGFLIGAMTITCGLRGADPVTVNVTRKLDLIQSGQAKPGAVFRFTQGELNAWVRAKAPAIVPDGFREPRLVLGNGQASASALIDFLKVRHASGLETNWLVSKLIQGEKLVRVRASIQSAHGRATVHVLQVEIGGLEVKGAPLDFLVQNFFLPFYPDAEIDKPFDLANRVDRIEVTPAGALVYMRR